MADITPQEYDKISRAFRHPEFRGLFQEYVDEISDPKHREEHDKYLRELEEKGEGKPGQRLIFPEPGCCVKTAVQHPNGSQQKLFINICQSERVHDMKQTSQDGGTSVSLPYVLGNPRPDKDHNGAGCLTCDMCVGTLTYKKLEDHRIMKLCVEEASNGMKRRYFTNNEEIKKDFKVLKYVRCKGDKPSPLSVNEKEIKPLKGKGKKDSTNRALSGAPSSSARAAPPDDADESITPAEVNRLLDKLKKDKAHKEGNTLDQPTTQEEATTAPAADAPPSASPPGGGGGVNGVKSEDEKGGEGQAAGAQGVVKPTYRIIYGQGELRIEGTLGHAHADKYLPSEALRPATSLKVEVELPGVSSASEIKTAEFTTDTLTVDVPHRYHLQELPLPLPVKYDDGTAKFQKTKAVPTLKLAVPVDIDALKARRKANTPTPAPAPDDNAAPPPDTHTARGQGEGDHSQQTTNGSHETEAAAAPAPAADVVAAPEVVASRSQALCDEELGTGSALHIVGTGGEAVQSADESAQNGNQDQDQDATASAAAEETQEGPIAGDAAAAPSEQRSSEKSGTILTRPQRDREALNGDLVERKQPPEEQRDDDDDQTPLLTNGCAPRPSPSSSIRTKVYDYPDNAASVISVLLELSGTTTMPSAVEIAVPHGEGSERQLQMTLLPGDGCGWEMMVVAPLKVTRTCDLVLEETRAFGVTFNGLQIHVELTKRAADTPPSAATRVTVPIKWREQQRLPADEEGGPEAAEEGAGECGEGREGDDGDEDEFTDMPLPSLSEALSGDRSVLSMHGIGTQVTLRDQSSWRYRE
ncbi:unnamed protein product [Vitrella brassicaformis CCMP3155]|uniref:PIH1 domain-containing protein 1 n=2 Tax=Vitrella brassicaformis TaxID=1169539 RepID=A0A0G4EU43_VITBC|nr:unnamed protein product [Vitrella brassicaformis CCMP3155]|eukprot:CEM01598.1 unnamed protein product [Vitrella brassicaformis CCMP3155]